MELKQNLIDMKEIILKELVKNRSLDTCNDFVLWADISELEVLSDKIEKAITVIPCCKSDSEQLVLFSRFISNNSKLTTWMTSTELLEEFNKQK